MPAVWFFPLCRRQTEVWLPIVAIPNKKLNLQFQYKSQINEENDIFNVTSFFSGQIFSLPNDRAYLETRNLLTVHQHVYICPVDTHVGVRFRILASR